MPRKVTEEVLERMEKLRFPPKGLEEFVPKVARGTWNPKSVEEVAHE